MFYFIIIFLFHSIRMNYIEIIINETTRIDSFQKTNIIIIERVYTRNKQEILLKRPLLLYLYIESAEIYPLEYLKSINNKLFPISFQHFQTENNSKKNIKQSTFCGYDSFDIHTAKPIKEFSCKHCLNQTCQTTTHCIRMDDYWYDVYDIDSRQLHFSLSLHIYELEDDFTWTLLLKTDLIDFPFVNKTTEIADIQITSLTTNEHSISNILLNEYKYLLEFHNEFMVINKSELNLDEDNICKKIVNTTDDQICSIECSKNQPFDFWLADKSNEMNKQPFHYVFQPHLDLPIHEYNHKFKFLIPYKQQFRLNITFKQNQSIGFECLISIIEISIESFSKYTFQIALIINNTGLSQCSIRISFKQNQLKNSYFIKQEYPYEYHISPMYEQLIFFTISIKRRQWKRIIFSPMYIQAKVNDLSTNSTLVERQFLLKYGHHCVCISICRCQCFKNTLIPNLSQLKCVSMLESDINQAGLSYVNHDRILKLLINHKNPMIEMMNEQSRYIRKWFLFIAVFALCLNILLVFTVK
ncbi:unnamed protein product [Rotaria sordida]|uniref:Uncharacterized protein n=1 Tax=Rotaria sordida TaxID=392033 RepID=A0A814UF81_9BILA|nr:unnamed protein product [Rotaria sordida]CAF1425157.1 unnamed protein product [Rotaria sordida]